RDRKVRQTLCATSSGRAERRICADQDGPKGKPVRSSLANSPALFRRASCLPHTASRMERLLHQEGRRSRATSQLYSEPPGAESSDRLLRLGGLGHNGESSWEGLLIHQQLALRAHGGKPSFHRGLCLERLESHHPSVRAGFDPLRRRQVRLLGLEGRRRWQPCYAL